MNFLSKFRRVTFAECCEEWWREKQSTLERKTAANYRYDIDRYLLPTFGESPVRDLTLSQLQVGFDSFNAAQATLKNPKIILKSVLDYSAKYGADATLAEKISLKSHALPLEIEIYTPAEIAAMLDVCACDWVKLAIQLAYATGMRRGEIFGLQWDDINFANRFLSVRRSITAIDATDCYVKSAKTKQSIRRVDLDADTLRLLAERHEQREPSSPYVLWGDADGHRNPYHLQHHFRVVCHRTSVTPRRFHTLRHTHASVLLAAGVNAKIVQERLGHAKISTTLDTYGHLIQGAQSAAVTAFERYRDGE